ncbi:MAG: phosphoribosylanthranilate isomerase [Candidatus Omnitrophica bacterium]|nr:phosphoribosylanthranilate isomerase [Candidatus Omnitrophota bacterium]
MTKVKICGITNLEDALFAQEAGADILGFIFAESARSVEPEVAADIIRRLSDGIKVSALFVNQEKAFVDKVIEQLGRVDLLQFHGDETPDYCRGFSGKEIIKVFRVKNEATLKRISNYKGVNFILLDTFKESQYGGTGEAFDWNIALKAREYGIPIFLSGGLRPDNVNEAVSKVTPYGVDVSSGVEASPGKKDPGLVKDFISEAKRGS